MKTTPSIDIVATGSKIASLRKDRGIKVSEIQNIFGFTTPQAIYKWERGTTLPTVDNLVILASIFEVSLEDILVIRCQKENER